MRKFLLLGLVVACAGCGMFYTIPTGKPGTPATAGSHKPVEFSAWLVFWDPLSWPDFEANVSRMARVYPEAYTCQPNGLPGRISVAHADDLARTVALAHQHGVKVLGTMNNYASETSDFESKRVQLFLHDPALMEKHVDGLIALAQTDGLDGLDVDYESLAAADRGAFSAFVARLSQKAHALGLLVGLAAHPKESEPGNWDGPKAQDYASLGKSVDFFHVMTYDYHWTSGSPGPVAPINWVASVMRYTASVVPADKIEMGINGYGIVWKPKGETLTWTLFQALQTKVGRFERDASSGELTKSFGGGEAWMPDAATTQAKLVVARDLGLRGAALWVLGQEDPRTWTVLDALNGK